MEIIVEKIFSIFLIIAVGFMANKLNIIPSAANDYLVKLLFTITAPCMVFSSIASKVLTEDTLDTTIQILIGAFAYFLIFTVVGYFLYSFLLRNKDKKDLGVYVFIFVSINSGFMGFPLSVALFGNDVLYLMVMHNLILIIYMYTVGPIILKLGQRKQDMAIAYNTSQSQQENDKTSKGSILALISSLKNPNTIAAFLSVIVLFSGIKIPTMLSDTLSLIGDATVPLSMIIVGLQLADSKLGSVLKNIPLLAGCIIKTIFIPILTFLLVNPLPISNIVKLTIIFAAVFPSAVAIVPIAATEGKNSLLAAEGVAITSILSVIAIPVFSMFLSNYFPLF